VESPPIHLKALIDVTEKEKRASEIQRRRLDCFSNIHYNDPLMNQDDIKSSWNVWYYE